MRVTFRHFRPAALPVTGAVLLLALAALLVLAALSTTSAGGARADDQWPTPPKPVVGALSAPAGVR
ncbi:hypothetical protein [Streptomyces smaragdinus]|uniref:hypothetical protein n=1 Tax=Streptomyces smaragdinus TaxID=2585196 RepID=UPI001296CFB5|nr:hypothetical protein [Streptomyces smaragdinus]